MRLLKNLIIVVIVILGFVFTFKYFNDNKVVILTFDQEGYQVNMGETSILEPIITKGRFAHNIELVYTSLAEEIVVYEDGIITPLKEGVAQVKVSLAGNEQVYAIANIEVVNLIKYKISYYLDGGTNHPLNPINYTINDLPINLHTPTKEGFVFKGWYMTNDFSGSEINILNDISSNIILYAKWEAIIQNIYSISYNLNGGINNSSNVARFEANNLPINLHEATRDGYTFIGWYASSNFSGEKITKITEAKDVILYAKWEKKVENSYNITFHLNDGTNNPLNKNQFTASSLPLVLYEPTRSGYVFKGWYTSSNFSGEKVSKIYFPEDISLYAKWELSNETSYSITYHLNGGTNNPLNPGQFTASSLPLVLHEPTRSGYVFKGWYTSSNFSGEKVSKIYFPEDVSVYAKWEEIKNYSITYVLNGGVNNINNVEVFSESNLPLTLYKPSKEGYIFVGWYFEYDFSSQSVEKILEAKDIVLYAKWTTVNDNSALAALEQAEHSKLASDYEFARQIIESLSDPTVKQHLMQRLNEIEVIEDDVIIDDSTIVD